MDRVKIATGCVARPLGAEEGKFDPATGWHMCGRPEATGSDGFCGKHLELFRSERENV